jgi:hypothetical protein
MGRGKERKLLWLEVLEGNGEWKPNVTQVYTPPRCSASITAPSAFSH